MQRVWLYVRSAGWWGISLMTGGVASYLIAAYEHISGHSVSAVVWVGLLGTVLFMVGSFLAWNSEHEKALLAGNPEILVEYEKSARDIVSPLFIKNLGGGNAYRVKIRDITNNAGAIVHFNEISYIEEKQTPQATGHFETFKITQPFFSHNFQAFLLDGKQGANIPESIDNLLAPKMFLTQPPKTRPSRM